MSWYEYNQNNSGGSFVVDDKVCHRVYIEANSIQEANDKADDLGIYFNGIDDGRDCSCCGDRWYEPEQLKFPIDYGKDGKFNNIVEYTQYLANKYGWTKPDAMIYYKSGHKKKIYKQLGQVKKAKSGMTIKEKTKIVEKVFND